MPSPSPSALSLPPAEMSRTPRKLNIWALFIFLVTISTIMLAFAVTISIKFPATRPKYCVNGNDPVFWELVSQTPLRLFLIMCLFIMVLRDQRDDEDSRKIKMGNYPVFYTTVGFSFTAQLTGLILYAVMCEYGWLANLLFGWAATVTVSGIVAYFVAVMDAPRAR